MGAKSAGSGTVPTPPRARSFRPGHRGDILSRMSDTRSELTHKVGVPAAAPPQVDAELPFDTASSGASCWF